jgi:hypothetical protein
VAGDEALLDEAGQDAVASLSQALLVLPLEYLLVAKLRTQRATWPVIAVLLPATLVLLEVDLVDPTVLLTATALVVLAWSVVDGQLFRSGMFRVQALGMVGFGTPALAGLAVDPDLGRWLVADGGSSMASGTSSTSGWTRWWPAPTPSGAASSTS